MGTSPQAGQHRISDRRRPRLSRSVKDFAGLLELARKEKWQVVCLDVGVDTSTPAGEMVANVMAAMAQFERQLIGQRTRDGMAIKRAQGVHCGRPRQIDASVAVRVRLARANGDTYAEIGKALVADGLLPPAAPSAGPPARWRAWPAPTRVAPLRRVGVWTNAAAPEH